MVLVNLINNLLLIIALSIITGFFEKKYPRSTLSGLIVQGILFGAVAIIGMLQSLILSQGLIFDGRSVIISLASLFFGPVTGLIAGIMAIIFRLAQGGSGMLPGILVIICSVVIGTTFHFYKKKRNENTTVSQLLYLGFTVHFAMLLMMFSLPFQIAISTIQQIGIPVILIFPLVTVLIGKILSDQEINARNFKIREASELKFRLIVENSHDGIEITQDDMIIYSNIQFAEMLGYSLDEISGMKFNKILTDRALNALYERQRIRSNGKLESFNNYETTYVKKDGTIIDVAVNYEIIKYNGRPATFATIRDITEGKRMENELRESEANLNEAMQIAKLGTWEYDVDSDQFEFNDQFYELLHTTAESEGGYTMSSRHYAQKFVHPDEMALVAVETNKAIESTDTNYRSQLDHRVIFADGGTGYFNVNIRIKKDSHGRTIKTFGVNQDITARKKAEEALIQSEELQRIVLSSIMDPVFITDGEGKFTFICPNVIHTIGYSIEELEEKENISSLIQNNLFIPEELRMRGKIANIEKSIVDKSGTLRNFLINVRQVNIGKGTCLYTLHDITERKQAEISLIESKGRYRNLVNAAPNAIVVHSEGIIVFANPATVKLVGVSGTQNLIGKPVMEFVHPDDREMAKKRIVEMFKSGIPAPLTNYRFIKMDGSVIYVEVAAVPTIFNGKKASLVILNNITERSLAESALKEVGAKLKEAMQIAKLGTWEYDVDSDQFEFNDQFYKLLHTTAAKEGGYKMSSMQYAQKFVHPDDMSVVGVETNKALETTDTNYHSHLDHRIIFADGGTCYFNVNIRIKKDSQGRTVKTYGVNQDITARKKAEEELVIIQQRLINAQRLSNMGSWSYDPVTQKPIWSEGMFRIWGLNPNLEAPEYSEHQKYIHPDDYQRFDYAVRNAVELGKPYELELRICRPDGVIITIVTICEPMCDASGKIISLEGTVQDITEQKRGQEALRKSREEFQTYFNSSAIGLSVSLPDMSWTEVNNKLCDIFGYTKKELLKKNWAELTHPEDLSSNMILFTQVLDGKIDSYSIDKRFIRKNGSTVYISLSTTCQRNDDGTVHHFLTSYNDITDRKLFEKEIIESKKQLELLYNQQNEIRENERAKISREIHDELGQMFTAIKMDLSSIKDRIPAGNNLNDKLVQMIGLVNASIKKTQRISADLRPSILDDIGLNAAIEWYSNEFEERSGIKSNLELEEFPDINPKANLVLFRILQETLTNVARHSKANNISIKLYSSSDSVSLVISDDGIGFNINELKPIESLGIRGMSERIKQFNGRFEIVSSINAGTKLTVTIPIINQALQ